VQQWREWSLFSTPGEPARQLFDVFYRRVGDNRVRARSTEAWPLRGPSAGGRVAREVRPRYARLRGRPQWT
jgi:hypothetical protein